MTSMTANVAALGRDRGTRKAFRRHNLNAAPIPAVVPPVPCARKSKLSDGLAKREPATCEDDVCPEFDKRRGSFQVSFVSKKKKIRRSSSKGSFSKHVPKPIVVDTFNMTSLEKSIDQVFQKPKKDKHKTKEEMVQKPKPKEGVVNIDRTGDILSSSVYTEHIISYLKTREAKHKLPEDLLHKKTAIKPSIRAVVVDWIIQVQDHSNLEVETLHLALALLDRMLSTHPVSTNKVQLVAITCIFIAAKVIEHFPPTIKQMLKWTDNTYKKNELMATERLVLKTLKFDVVLPTPVTFLDRCLQASACDMCKRKLREVRRMAAFLLEQSFTDCRIMVKAPSLRASAATWLARRLLLPSGMEAWSRNLIHYSGYTEEEVLPVVARMASQVLNRDTTKFKGAWRKYRSTSRHGAVSAHPSLTNTPGILETVKSTLKGRRYSFADA